MLTQELKKKILQAQKNEATEHLIYRRLSCCLKDKARAQILEKISGDELAHYEFWKSLTREDVLPDKGKVRYFTWLAKLFGLTFALKLMENGEESAQDVYATLTEASAEVSKIIRDEEAHENQLIDMIDEERLLYVSSVVLGLNDALVELTGALVGFSLALQKAHLVAVVGSITGIAAALSMAASEYLSTKQEDTKKDPARASIYTGLTYFVTVILLVMPYMFFSNIYLCIGMVVCTALFAIFVFTFYISVAKGFDFKARFLEMAGISLSIAAINYGIGLAIRHWFKIDL